MAGKAGTTRVQAVKATPTKRAKATHVVRLTDETYDIALEVQAERELASVTESVNYLVRYAAARRAALLRDKQKAGR
jgi:hypothetical protein